MEIYLKGYYGYKNFGDELLLLGVLSFLYQNHKPSKIYIESQNTLWLTSWLSRHNHYLSVPLNSISCVLPGSPYRHGTVKVFGGGEVVTDGRPFPYNGWNYLIKYPRDILQGNYILLGGVGTPKKLMTKVLYKILLPRAQYITVREKFSYQVASQYTQNVEQYHDFSDDILPKIQYNKSGSPDKVLLNCNPYIWNTDSTNQMIQAVENNSTFTPYFMPADILQDTPYYYKLKKDIPHLQLYDRTKFSLKETLEFLSGVGYAVAARLHILLMLQHLGVSYKPLVYQEKISKFFDS